MEKNSVELHELENLIEYEKNIYSEAIKNNLQFEEVKTIFLKIKKLEKEAATLIKDKSAADNISYSAKDEILFSKIKRAYIARAQAYIGAIENLTLEDMVDPVAYSNITSLNYQSALACSKLNEFIHTIVVNNREHRSSNSFTTLK